MASQNNILRLADFPSRIDPVIAARDRMNSAKTDIDYEAARSALVRAVPRTLEGARVKQALGRKLVLSISEGDVLTARGWKEAGALLSAVDKFVERVA